MARPSLLLAMLVLMAVPARPGHAQAPPPSRAGAIAPAADYAAVLTGLLERAVTEDGRVRYDLLRGPLRDDLRRVLKHVEEYDATRLTGHAEQLTFWLNAYNVQMLWHIVETPAVDDIVADGYADAFFETPLRTAGLGLTLNEIENVILRGEDGRAALAAYRLDRLDPRVHVGLNCAALACPPLPRAAFTPGTVDALLDAAFRAFVASPAHLRVEGDRVILSSILDWYGGDFDRPGLAAGDYLLRAMPPSRPGYARLRAVLAGRTAGQIRAHPAVTFAYDWRVNRASR